MNQIDKSDYSGAPQLSEFCPNQCIWKYNNVYDCYETSCGQAFYFIDGTPGENNMGFCCYCGKPIKEKGAKKS